MRNAADKRSCRASTETCETSGLWFSFDPFLRARSFSKRVDIPLVFGGSLFSCSRLTAEDKDGGGMEGGSSQGTMSFISALNKYRVAFFFFYHELQINLTFSPSDSFLLVSSADRSSCALPACRHIRKRWPSRPNRRLTRSGTGERGKYSSWQMIESGSGRPLLSSFKYKVKHLWKTKFWCL